MQTVDDYLPTDAGELLGEYGTCSSGHIMILVVAPFLAAFFLGCWVYSLIVQGFDFESLGFYIGAFILLGMTGLLLTGWGIALAAIGWRVLLFENGFLFRKRSSARWVGWADVAEYYQVHVFLHGVSTGNRLYVHLRSGRKVSIEGIFKDVNVVVENIKAAMIPHLTRDAEDRLSRDVLLDFRHVELGRDGLHTSSEIIPWMDVHRVAVEDHKGVDFHVVVEVASKNPEWLSVPVNAFPSVEVFLRLADTLMKA